MMSKTRLLLAVCLLSASAAGCRSPYRSDQGALFGGLMGAGVGAIVGNAVGDPLAGAAIGAGAGAISGAVVGDQLDQIEAQNQAEIEARLGRPIAAGAVSIDDVIAMTQAGVEEEVIVNHVRIHGALHPLQTVDIIHLKNSGVGPRVISAMQSPPVERTVVRQAPPVIVEEYYYDDPWCHHRPYYHHHYRHHHHHNPHVSIGFSSHH